MKKAKEGVACVDQEKRCPCDYNCKYSIIKTFRVCGTVDNLPGLGRKRKINPGMNRTILQMKKEEDEAKDNFQRDTK